MSIRRSLPVALALSLAALACALPTGPATPSADDVATRVAATRTAEAPSGSASPEGPHGLVTVEPTPSPEPVRRIIYTDAGNIWRIDEGGSPVQVTTSGDALDVRISSDGHRIAYTYSDPAATHGGLRAVHADGSGEILLLSTAALDAFYPIHEGTVGTDIAVFDFIPGTHTLVFNTYAVPEFIGYIQHDDLWAIDVDAGTRTSLLPAGSGGDFVISPDGSLIAVVQPTSIGLIDSGGSNHRPDLVDYAQVITYSEFLYYALPVWSPDSSAFGAAIPSDDPLAPSPTGTAWRIPTDGSPAVPLGTIPGNVYLGFWRSASLSPDLSRVAFTRQSTAPGRQDLYLASADGTGEVLIATGDIQWFGWAPDGTHCAYSASAPASLTIGQVGGGSLTVGPGSDLRWMTDSEFLYLAGSLGAWTLNRGTTAGGTTLLASPAGDFVSYDFNW